MGSTTAITTATGVFTQDFTAFGAPSTEPATATGVLAAFTGHESDTDLALINMRGRIYDPIFGRFLTPDPIQQAPFWSQGLNPYAYVYNNPTNLVDPSGFFATGQNDIDAAAGIGAWAGGLVAGSAFSGFGVGTFTGAASGLSGLFGGGGSSGPNVHTGTAAAKSAPGGRAGYDAAAHSKAAANTPLEMYNDQAMPEGLGNQPDQRTACGHWGAHCAADDLTPEQRAAMDKGTTLSGKAILAGGIVRAVATELARAVVSSLVRTASESPSSRPPAPPPVPQLTITFGRNANQIHHAFRHTDKLGLSRTAVQDAIRKHLPSVADKIPIGKPLNQVIEVAGKRIQYSAFRLADGSVNVGRIHGVP